MGELTPLGGAAAATSDGLSAVAYGLVIAGLSDAGARLSGLAERVRSTYRYVDRCADGVEQLADQMQGLTVDVDTVSEHHEAAALMRAVLETAEQLAAATEDLSTRFSHTAAAHEGDYGTVAATAQSMTVPMADGQFYSNR